MMSYCDVTNNVYTVTMTTIGHCIILEFGKWAYNETVAQGITRPLHATQLRNRIAGVVDEVVLAACGKTAVGHKPDSKL